MRHSSKIQTDSGMMFDVKVEDTGVYNIIRPIVTDELKGGQSIGPEFSKVITVAASYQENSNEESTEQVRALLGLISYSLMFSY